MIFYTTGVLQKCSLQLRLHFLINPNFNFISAFSGIVVATSLLAKWPPLLYWNMG
jgi:hypothetical protein